MTRAGSRAEAILDAAERRLRQGGYYGFSFRDLAADVGIKSASVHHHFPTKEDLVAQLIARYARRFLAEVAAAPCGWERVRAYRAAFRRAIDGNCRMCLCGLLSAESSSLPPAIVAGTRDFFARLIAHLAEGLEGAVPDPEDTAVAVLAQLEGAALLARPFGDISLFDRATAGLEQPPEAEAGRRSAPSRLT